MTALTSQTVQTVQTALTTLPLAPWPVLLLCAGLGGVLIWWPAGSQERTDTLVSRLRRSAMVALLVVAALRPGVPGGDVTVDATDLDVYFLVDTTSSVMAEDYTGARPRLEGVRADVREIAAQLPGARYSLLTFDHDAVTRLPLTSDGAALASAADTIRAETSTFSRGSSITVAGPALARTLQRGHEAHPERARVVFYLGDGEQTTPGDPAPFAVDRALVNGGAVLGYGTAAGGQMKQTGTRQDAFITDPSTGQPARSVIDEPRLRTIGEQLGLAYLHRTSDNGAGSVVDAIRLKELSSLTSSDQSRSVGSRTEWYWPFLLALAALAAFELGAAIAAAAALRDRASSSRRARGAVAPTAGDVRSRGATTAGDP